MTWFFIALIGPLLYALTNHLDKLLLQKYFREGGVGTLVIFSALASALALPVLFAIEPTPFSVGPLNVAALALVGVLNALVLWSYLQALKEEEASVAVVFYQMVPVFGYAIGYLLLNEVLTQLQAIAMATIIVGASIISVEIDDNRRMRLRIRTIVYMLAASLFWALESVIFKAVALEENVVRSLFWEHLMLTIIGIAIFAIVPLYRNHFLTALRRNSYGILSLNIFNESLYMLGNVAFSFAYVLAPIALVLLAESYQPLFVLAIGVLITRFAPALGGEKIHAHHVWQKGLAVVVTGVGTYLLFIAQPA